MEGYAHPLYAEAFVEWGQPIYLNHSRGWLIKRSISGTVLFDAMGPYPLFFCEDWNALLDDFQEISSELVGVSLVISPFDSFPMEFFQQYFDIIKPYKDHYILDTGVPIEQAVSKICLRDARRSLKDVFIDYVVAPDIDVDEWMPLYDSLIRRHSIEGIRAFSRASFSKQIAVPNTHFFRAWHAGELIGGNLYYLQQDVAYGHLLALNDEGYRLGASHAITLVAIQTLAKQVKWIDYGGAAGSGNEKPSGLQKFKKGWTNLGRPTYFCAKIFNQEKYEELIAKRPNADPDWFPAYRSGDFG